MYTSFISGWEASSRAAPDIPFALRSLISMNTPSMRSAKSSMLNSSAWSVVNILTDESGSSSAILAFSDSAAAGSSSHIR